MIIELTELTGDYWQATSPDHPGAITAGPTKRAALINLLDTIQQMEVDTPETTKCS